MSEWDYSDDWGATYDPSYYYAGGSPTFDESGGSSAPIGPGLGWDFSSSPAYQQFTGWGDPTGVGSSGDTGFTGEGSGNWLSSVLGSLGGLGGAGGLSSLLGPALSAAGGIAGGAMGANASNEAARLQAAALNRGIDLQTAQWLQQQANQAPWLQAGQQALPQLQQLAGQGPQAPFQPGASIDPRAYAMPNATPGWQPQGFQRPDVVDPGAYRYTPGQGPRAADYRYTPGAVPTLQGAELLAHDPGYQFRQDEARKALEASALARGTGMSGGTMSALQRQSQDLASQEYGQAWNRASQQAQMREAWNQTAQQMGWTQAQAEAAFREQMAQQASAQNFTQAQAAQQANFGQGMQTAQYAQQEQQAYAQQLYNQLMQQQQMRYGMDTAQNQTDYERQLAAYNSQLQHQGTQWNRLAALSGVGQTSAEQLGKYGYANTNQIGTLLGQLGTAQGTGALNQGNAWSNALSNVGTAVQGGLANQQLLSVLSNLNR